MSRSRKLLIFGGLALAAFGMLYGLHYALFVEHQTLDRMGGSLTAAFVAAANADTQQAGQAIHAYGATKYNYVRQVDAHSHWGGLAMLMIVLGAVFDRVRLSERLRHYLALALGAGSLLFPLGVLLQTAGTGSTFASAVAVAGSALVTLAVLGVAIGFARESA
jgi:hypothetical protein